jgi:hypothetical protein
VRKKASQLKRPCEFLGKGMSVFDGEVEGMEMRRGRKGIFFPQYFGSMSFQY